VETDGKRGAITGLGEGAEELGVARLNSSARCLIESGEKHSSLSE
jgi:hypothetical protein